jgi:hypothetical protein
MNMGGFFILLSLALPTHHNHGRNYGDTGQCDNQIIQHIPTSMRLNGLFIILSHFPIQAVRQGSAAEQCGEKQFISLFFMAASPCAIVLSATLQ